MTLSRENIEDGKKPNGTRFAETLERARRRYDGEVILVTDSDEYWTACMIWLATYDFDRNARFSLLMSVIGNTLASIRPIASRKKAYRHVLNLLRKYVDDAARDGDYRTRPKKNEAKVAARVNLSCGAFYLDDFTLADAAFERALRRRLGEEIDATVEDLRGTVALIHQLMTDIDYIVLIEMTANAIVEECDGPPPKAVFAEVKRIISSGIKESDLIHRSYDGPLN